MMYYTKSKGNIRSEWNPPKVFLESQRLVKQDEVVYVLKATVEDYKNILSNPQAFALIYDRLLKNGILENLYELLTKNAFHMFKKTDKKFYDFLPIFKSLVPNMDISSVPRDSAELFEKAIKEAGDEELEERRKDFVHWLLQNPINVKNVFFYVWFS
jgi:hypothetical protein